jgi:hypothetical protein
MAMTKVLEWRQVAVERRAGTDFPVVNQLTREQLPGRRPEWRIVYGLCNGVPDSASEHRTLAAARREWEEVS